MKKVVFLLLIVFCASGVFAQSAGDFGLVYRIDPSPSLWPSNAAYPNPPIFNLDKFHGIGIIYHFSETTAINPVLTFGSIKFATEYEPEGGTSTDIREESLFVFGIEATVPIYLKKAGNVSIFLAPGARINMASNKYEDKTEPPAPKETVKFFNFGALFNVGGQAFFGNFSVFSSWGMAFDYVSLTAKEEDVGEGKIKGPAFSTNQISIGLIYYLEN